MTSFLRSTSRRFSISKDTVDEPTTTVNDGKAEDTTESTFTESTHLGMDDSSCRGGGLGGSIRGMWRRTSSRGVLDFSQSNHKDLAPIKSQDLKEEVEEEEEDLSGTEFASEDFCGDTEDSEDESSDGDDYMDGSVPSLQKMRDHSLKSNKMDGSRSLRRTRRSLRRQCTFESVDSCTILRITEQDEEEENEMDVSNMGVSLRESFRRFGRRFSLSDVTAPEAAPARSVRKLPQRQGTSNTEISTDSLHSGFYTCGDEQSEWEEERVELMEKVEALEQKLDTKEAVIQCLMPPKEEEDIADPTALLKAKVQEQALYIEELEEAQQRPCEPSLWERVVEQEEKISRMEAEHQYQMQQQLLKQKHLEDLVRKLMLEKHSTQSDSDCE